MDDFKINGQVKLDIIRNGKLIDSTGWIKNVITSVGKAQIALLAGAAGTPFTYLAVGTSNTAVNASDTTLGAEISTNNLSRAAATVSRITTSVTNDTLQLTFTWTASGSSTVQEIGTFNAASVGVMLNHALTGSKALISGDGLIATVQIQFT